MDAFAAAVCIGLNVKKAVSKNSLITGLYFGVFQAVMPLIGYFTAQLFAGTIPVLDHWVAFILLLIIGTKTIIEGCKKSEGSALESFGQPDNEKEQNSDYIIRPAKMLPLAVATSIDALAVGISFAFLQTEIISAASFIGITTFLLSVAGVKIGNVFGIRCKSSAELTGGIILVLLGVKILFEHLNILKF